MRYLAKLNIVKRLNYAYFPNIDYPLLPSQRSHILTPTEKIRIALAKFSQDELITPDTVREKIPEDSDVTDKRIRDALSEFAKNGHVIKAAPFGSFFYQLTDLGHQMTELFYVSLVKLLQGNHHIKIPDGSGGKIDLDIAIARMQHQKDMITPILLSQYEPYSRTAEAIEKRKTIDDAESR